VDVVSCGGHLSLDEKVSHVSMKFVVGIGTLHPIAKVAANARTAAQLGGHRLRVTCASGLEDEPLSRVAQDLVELELNLRHLGL
jgi:hypothetical protein